MSHKPFTLIGLYQCTACPTRHKIPNSTEEKPFKVPTVAVDLELSFDASTPGHIKVDCGKSRYFPTDVLASCNPDNKNELHILKLVGFITEPE